MPENSTRRVVGPNIASGKLSATFVKPERDLVHEFVTEYLRSAQNLSHMGHILGVGITCLTAATERRREGLYEPSGSRSSASKSSGRVNIASSPACVRGHDSRGLSQYSSIPF